MSRRLLPQALVVGFVLGLAAGLVYTWDVNPLQFTNTYPSLLRQEFRRDWVRLAALSYAAGDSLDRTHARVEGLNEQDIARALESLIEEYASEGSPHTLGRLTTLAAALDADVPPEMIAMRPSVSSSATATRAASASRTPSATPTSIPTPSPTTAPTSSATPTATETWTPSPTESPTPSATPSATPTATATPSPSPTLTRVPTNTPSPTRTPAPTDTPRPSPTSSPTPTRRPTSTPTRTATPTASPTPPFLQRLEVQAEEQLCDAAEPLRIEVVVQDENGEGVPAVVVWLAWAQGVDRAVTGLKPDKGLGYADFGAEPNTTYSISVGQLEMPLVSGLQLESCPAGSAEDPDLGSWRIVLAPEE